MINNLITINERAYKSVLFKIYAYKFFAWFHMFSAIIIPFFTEWAHLSILEFMLLESWCMLCMFIFEIPTGGIADYIGRKNTLQIGLLIQAIGFGVYVSMPNFYIYMLGEAIVALGFSLTSGAEEAFIYDTLKSFDKESESKKVFGRAESFGLAGIMTGAPFGSLLAQNMGLQYPMLFMFIPFAVAFVLLVLLKESKVKGSKHEKRSYIEIVKKGTLIFYKHGVLKILAADLVLISTMGFLMIWLYQLMLKEAGVNLLFFGLVNTCIIITEIILLNSYIKLEKLLKSKKRLIFLSALLIGVMFIIGSLTRYMPVVILVILTVCSFAMTRRTLMVNYMNKYIPSEERATVLSSISMLISFGKMLFFPLVGFFIEKISLSVVLMSLGIITLIFAFISKVEEEHLVD